MEIVLGITVVLALVALVVFLRSKTPNAVSESKLAAERKARSYRNNGTYETDSSGMMSFIPAAGATYYADSSSGYSDGGFSGSGGSFGGDSGSSSGGDSGGGDGGGGGGGD